VRALDRLDRLSRNSRDDAFLKRAGPSLTFLELDGDGGGLYDLEGGFNDLRADTITRKYSYLRFAGVIRGT